MNIRRWAVVGVLLVAASLGAVANGDPYAKPLQPRGFTAKGTALPARSIGATVLRAQPSLAVEVLVQLDDYLPRALEPRLVIDGQPVTTPTRVVNVDGKTTTIGFLLDKPALVREGATLEVQMGDDTRTRARVPGQIQRDRIQSVPDDELRRLGLPKMHEWLEAPR